MSAEGGAWGEVVFMRSTDGSCPMLEYLDALDTQAQVQFKARARRLAEIGRIHNDQQFRKLQSPGTPPIWELKIDAGSGHRFFCWSEDRKWVFSHGVRKPAGNRRYASEISRARKAYQERNPT